MSEQDPPTPDQGTVRAAGPKSRRLPAPAVRPRPRLVVADVLYYQPAGGAPVSRESRFSRWLDDAAGDGVYVRPRATALEEWQPLDTGWVRECAQLLLENLEGKFTQLVPTQEEREAAARLVIQLGIGPEPGTEDPWITAFAEVPPGESCRLRPCGGPGTGYYVRCPVGPAKYAVTLVPR